MISVVIPTFNRAKTVARAIDSVLEQTYRDIEIIVVDDGSSDGSDEVFSRYGDRINVIRQSNAGPSAARNRGIEAANGEIVAFLDSDDIWLPEKLERQVQFFDGSDDEPVCCICNARVEDSDRNPTTSFDLAGFSGSPECGLLRNPYPVMATRFILFNQVVAVRRDVLIRLGGFKEGLWLLEDYDLALRLSRMGAWGIISTPLVVKDNETEGIGVQAMRNPSNQFPIQARIIEDCLATSSQDGEAGSRYLRRMLRNLNTAIRGTELAESRSGLSALAGKFLLRLTRLERRLWRKLPDWPGAEIVARMEKVPLAASFE